MSGAVALRPQTAARGGAHINNDIIIAFCVFQLSFLLLDLYILLKTNRDIVRKGEYTWFCALTCSHILYLVLNSIWTLEEYGLIDLPRRVLLCLYSASLWTVTNCATSFFLFVVERQQLARFRSGAGRWLRQLPAAISTVLIAVTPWTGLVFRLGEDNHLLHGPLYLPTMALSSLYLLFVAAIAGVNMSRKRTAFLRKANGALLGSVLIILLFIVADGTFSKATILPVAVFAVILIIFITLQEASINSDALTGMNNRRRAEEYLSEALTDVSAADPLYLFIGDLDGFKKINDTYGHIEGDDALILCSRVLKNTLARVDGFAARYGGDEFLMAWKPEKDAPADPEPLMREINRQLEEISAEKPYILRMTIGYALCKDPKELLRTCIAQADEMLYRKKAASAGSGR